MHFVCDQVLVHKIAPVPTPQQVPPFLSGLAAMTFDGLWMVTQFSKEITDFEWDITSPPCNPRTGSCTSNATVDGWAVASSTKERQASWEMAKHIVSDVGQRIFVEETKWPPCTKPGMEIWMNLPAPPESRQVVRDALVDQHNAWAVIGGDEFVSEVGQPTFDRVILGEITVEQGAATIQKAMQQVLDEAWQLVGSL
jgi:ABC-type glycerol-3-phosphate transport system substrate-binding protein